MGKKMIKRLIAGMLTAAVAIPTNFMPVQAAKQTAEDYVIYPTPHKMEYQEGDYILGKEMNVIYELMRRQKTGWRRLRRSKILR